MAEQKSQSQSPLTEILAEAKRLRASTRRLVKLLRTVDELSPPGISRDGGIPGFTTTEWAALSVKVNLALTGIAPHDLKMDTTIIDHLIGELERAEKK
jgi:hypothetical protein